MKEDLFILAVFGTGWCLLMLAWAIAEEVAARRHAVKRRLRAFCGGATPKACSAPRFPEDSQARESVRSTSERVQ